MLVVSDTSVLLNLCRVSAEGLLPALFREVWVPPAVAAGFARLAESRARFQGEIHKKTVPLEVCTRWFRDTR